MGIGDWDWGTGSAMLDLITSDKTPNAYLGGERIGGVIGEPGMGKGEAGWENAC